MKKLRILLAVSLLVSGNAYSQSQKAAKMKETKQQDHYTFELSDKVTRKKVTFKNRYGITIAGDLYSASGLHQISRNFTWVKIISGIPLRG